MTHIYCSKKLESFIGKVEPLPKGTDGNYFGNWNGHLFSIERRKNLIFTNDKTAYSFVLFDVVKKDIKDFGSVFRENLVRQLEYDLKINEQQETKLRYELRDIKLQPTNNNKNITGTINDFVQTIKLHAYLKGGLGQLNALKIGENLNDNFLKTKLELKTTEYFHPRELMKKILK